VPEKPAFDIVFNRGREDEFSVSVRQSDLREAFIEYIGNAGVTLFGRSFDALDSRGVAEAAEHYAQAAYGAVADWGAVMGGSDGERTD